MWRFVRLKLIVVILALILVACSGESSNPEVLLDPNTDAGRGQALFRTYCATCHAIKGSRVIVGPSLDGVARRAARRIPDLSAEEYLYESILYPDNYIVEGFIKGSMQQTFDRQLSTEQVNYLVSYLMTLK
jgi:mono/diheme cytochrome c family protein